VVNLPNLNEITQNNHGTIYTIMLTTDTNVFQQRNLSLSLHFNGHFPGELGLIKIKSNHLFMIKTITKCQGLKENTHRHL